MSRSTVTALRRVRRLETVSNSRTAAHSEPRRSALGAPLRQTCTRQLRRQVAPDTIFAKYFDRKPPFDGADSKEFPDAFVVEALTYWAETQNDQIYLVTEDKAMRRAVTANPHLLALNTIQDVLTRAAADLGQQAEAIANNLLSHAAFKTTLRRLLRAQIKDASYVYTGELEEGEAYDGELLAIEAVGDCSVVSLNDRRISLILDVILKVRVQVQFEDYDSAVFDRARTFLRLD